MVEFSVKKMEKCMNWGHNWAIQDNGTFLTKVCLNCGVKINFFAPEEDEDE